MCSTRPSRTSSALRWVQAHCSPHTTYYPLLTLSAYHTQHTAHGTPPTARFPALTAHHLLPTAHCLPPTADRSLLTAHHTPLTTHCSLLTTYYSPGTLTRRRMEAVVAALKAEAASLRFPTLDAHAVSAVRWMATWDGIHYSFSVKHGLTGPVGEVV